MKKDNIIQKKSYDFALSCIELCKFLHSKHNEYVLSKQLLKSGTSIGANIEESIGAQSSKDFLSKISIAYKETRETHYWIRLLRDSNYIDDKQSTEILGKCEEILRIITSIQKTVKQNIKKTNQ